ncbi:MAG TPA: hypothetical protein VJZ27_06650, partial [Aggregatilineales bacterium]|nr:hypothetical protein [Aggregatilineales bacterium]
MRDKRPVDELSVEELERILMTKKREARIQRFRGNEERRVAVPLQQHEAAAQIPAPAEPVTYDVTREAPHFDDETFDDGGVPQFEDELAVTGEAVPNRSYHPVAGYPAEPEIGFFRRVFNAFLLLVEASAVIGLIVLLYLAYTGVLTVNRNIEKTDSINATSEAELAMRQIQPTATPLISVSQVVIPGGHVWDPSGQHRFNINEV